MYKLSNAGLFPLDMPSLLKRTSHSPQLLSACLVRPFPDTALSAISLSPPSKDDSHCCSERGCSDAIRVVLRLVSLLTECVTSFLAQPTATPWLYFISFLHFCIFTFFWVLGRIFLFERMCMQDRTSINGAAQLRNRYSR